MQQLGRTVLFRTLLAGRPDLRCLTVLVWLLPIAADAVDVLTAGPEFHVTSSTGGDQRIPDVAVSPSGDALFVWESSGVSARRFSSSGAAVGTEFRVNNGLNSGQFTAPHAVSQPNGNFVVSWFIRGFLDDFDVEAVRLSPLGATLGSQFIVNPNDTGANSSPALAANAAGDFAVVWESKNVDGSGLGILARSYTSAGAAWGGALQVNQTTAGDQSTPALTSMADGGFVASWQTPFGAQSIVAARRLSSVGTPLGTEFVVRSGGASESFVDSDLSGQPDGNFVAAYYDPSNVGVLGKRFSASGSVGSEFQANTDVNNKHGYPRLNSSPNGDFVVAWQSYNQDGYPNAYGVFGRRFASSGVPLGAEFQVNVFTGYDQKNPALKTITDREFIVTWESFWQGGPGGGGSSDLDVMARRFAVVTATPTPTFTNPPPSATSSPTRTPTRTPTSSPTSSPTITPSPTITLTPSITVTATITPTASATRTPTRTPSSTPTSTATSSPSASPTRTPTRTFTTTATPTLTPTRTPTASPTRSATATPTSTPTHTASTSPTSSPSRTPTSTPTSTGTPTSSPTVTPTRTATSSPTRTATSTPTRTPTHTASASPSASPTRTATATPTNTPTSTPTFTASATPSSSQTATSSPTQTATNTLSRTPTSSPTRTPTATPSTTATPSATPSMTSTTTTTSTPTPASLTCPSTPMNGCQMPSSGLLILRDSSDDSRDRLVWKLKRGPSIPLAALGDPQHSAGVAFCAYDGAALVLDLLVPPSPSLWKVLSTKGFKYSDPTGSADGVIGAKLLSGAAGKSKLQVKGRGAGIGLPVVPPGEQFFSSPAGVRAQLRTSAGCFETHFSPAQSTQTSTTFKGKF